MTQTIGRVHSFSPERAGTFYQVTMGDDGIIRCSCKAYLYCREAVRTCKHLPTYLRAATQAVTTGVPLDVRLTVFRA